MAIEEKLTTEEKGAFTKAVTERWKRWKNGRKAKEDIWDECFNMFVSEFSDTSEIDDFRSQRYVPLSFEAIMNVNSQMQKGLFPNDRFFTAVGDSRAAQEHEKIRTIYMQNRMEASGFVEEYVASHVWQLLVFGNSPYMLGWDSRRSRSRQTFKDKDGEERPGFQYQVGGETVEHSISPYIYDGPTFQTLDLYNFVRDPFADSTSHGEIKIYRSKISKAELQAQAETEVNGYSVYDKKAVKAALDDSEDVPKETSDSQEQARREAFGISDTDKPDADEVELLWAHGDFPLKEMHVDYIVVVVNRKHLIRCELSPFKSGLSPLRMTGLIPVKGLPYSLGILESAIGQQEIVNIRTNQTIDSMALILNPMFKAKDDGVLDIENIVSSPGAAVLVDEMDSFEWLYPPQQAFTGYNEANVHKAEFVDATFSHKNFGAQSREQTATEVAASASMMATVLGRFVQRCENEDIENVLLWFDEVEKQFYDPNAEDPFARYEKGGKEEFATVGPEVIYKPYTWKAQGSGFTHLRETRVQQLFAWGTNMAQTPGVQGIDWEEYGRIMLREMGRRDADKLLPGMKGMLDEAQETGEIPPQLQAILQAQGAGGEAGGEGLIAPGSRNAPGVPPSRRGAIPNAGGGAIPTAG